MSAHTHTHEPPLLSRKDVMYPDSDGNPMSDNTLQFEWITTLHFGFLALFADDPNVFVASDLLWYPVEGQPKVRVAPDVLIAFGRPKGFRGSYKQWDEGGIAPQVVIEILSPGNKPMEMIEKHRFYERHGVEEYYLYDPDPGDESLAGYLRSGEHLMLLPDMQGWISPRTGVKFALDDGRLVCTRHDGKVFEPYLDVMLRAQDEADRAIEESRRADEESRRANEESRRANEESRRANEESCRADEESRRANEESRRAERLASKLRELGVDPSAV